jgi:hypothetical protein
VSPAFAFPDWAAQSDPSPPSPPPVIDPHRIGDLVNGFIAAKQDALFDAADAFYRQGGADAVAGASGVAQRLTDLRDTTLEQAADDGERQALGAQLDAQLADAFDGIDRHVTRERDAHHRQILSERQRLIERAAELEHNNDAKLAGLADANAGTAQVLARLDGLPEEPAMQAARSAVWRSAIGQRLVVGQNSDAFDLFQRVNDQLVPGDQRALDAPVQSARTDAAADAWITREQDKPGEPLPTRVQADPDLSPSEKTATLAKIEARNSAKESARVATVAGLNDKLDAASEALATKPGTYRTGTLAALADAYEEAGETNKAGTIRRLAEREGFLQHFARSSVDAQQRLIDSLPDGEDRAAAEAIRDRQAEAFAKDPFAAGTALYPDVGPPKPIDDVASRVAQARTIAAYRGLQLLPFTADEIAKMRWSLANTTNEREAVLSLVDSLPVDIRPTLVPPDSMSDALDDPMRDGEQIAQLPPVIVWGRTPPIIGPRPPLTPLEQLPEGSANGPRAGEPFTQGLKDSYPEGTPCTYCGQPTTKEGPGPDQFQLDHIIPRSQGGDGTPPNATPSCRTCNLEKGPRTPKQWYDWRGVY